MRRTVIIAPGLVGSSDSDSVLLQDLPSIRTLTELSRFVKVAPIPPVGTPEALYLGLPPSEAQLAQGPLTVAALGASPPDRSIHFHLSLMSVAGGLVQLPRHAPVDPELETLWTAAQRLNTRSLTLLRGEGVDHALVWEGLGEFDTRSPREAAGKPMSASLPEGEAEVQLRRLIDDSVNILEELELNDRRRDEGLEPFNLLWPWGAGRRLRVPNLILERGEVATVESSSMRMEGLARLAGYRHEGRTQFGAGLQVRLDQLASRALQRDITLILLETPNLLREDEKMEELEWFARQLDQRLIRPLLDSALQKKETLALIAPATENGLAAVLDFPTGNNVFPFDERALDESTISTGDLWTIIDQAITSPSAALEARDQVANAGEEDTDRN